MYGETREAYRDWWLGGKGSRPDRATAEARLRRHMPELVDVHGELVGLAGDDDTVAAMLTPRNPPPSLSLRRGGRARPPHRRTGAPAQLRLRTTPVRGDRLPVALERAAREGYRRLPVGVGGRRQRRRPRPVADLRRASRRGEGFGFLGDPLCAGGRGDVAEGVEASGRVRTSRPTTPRRATARARRPWSSSRGTGQPGHGPGCHHQPSRVGGRPEHASWVRSVERLELLREPEASGADDRSTVAAMPSPPLLARRWSEGFANAVHGR